MSLGDLFPSDFRNDFAERNINLGRALLVKIDSINVDYPKFVIIIGIDDSKSEVGYVIINSEINPNIFPTSFLQSQHITINSSEHDFLVYDSYVDCTQIKAFSKEKLLNFIKDYPENVKCNVSEEVFKKIAVTISLSKLISKFDKERFGFL